MIELIGYLGSLLVALSLLMSNIKKLRILNLLGSISFTSYGFLTKTYPVMLVNLLISVINIWYLAQMRIRKDFFKILEVQTSDAYLENFLNFYCEDIKLFFPNFSHKKITSPKCVFILRNLISAGLFIYTVKENTAIIELDYVTPEYRDFKNARYFFTSNNINRIFPEIKYLETKSSSKKHLNYLLKTGFIESKERNGVFIKDIR